MRQREPVGPGHSRPVFLSDPYFVPIQLRVDRGDEVCVEVVDPSRGTRKPVEDPIIAFRLSGDGRTLWLNNQLSEVLSVTVFVRIADQAWYPAPGRPVAPHSVLELGFDHPVEAALLSNFWFETVPDGAAGDQPP